MNAIQGDIHDRDPVELAPLAPQSEDFVQIVDLDGSAWLRRSSIESVESCSTHPYRYFGLRVVLKGVDQPFHFKFDDEPTRSKAISLLIYPPIT